jgi:hypothetical protein
MKLQADHIDRCDEILRERRHLPLLLLAARPLPACHAYGRVGAARVEPAVGSIRCVGGWGVRIQSPASANLHVGGPNDVWTCQSAGKLTGFCGGAEVVMDRHRTVQPAGTQQKPPGSLTTLHYDFKEVDIGAAWCCSNAAAQQPAPAQQLIKYCTVQRGHSTFHSDHHRMPESWAAVELTLAAWAGKCAGRRLVSFQVSPLRPASLSSHRIIPSNSTISHTGLTPKPISRLQPDPPSRHLPQDALRRFAGIVDLRTCTKLHYTSALTLLLQRRT